MQDTHRKKEEKLRTLLIEMLIKSLYYILIDINAGYVRHIPL